MDYICCWGLGGIGLLLLLYEYFTVLQHPVRADRAKLVKKWEVWGGDSHSYCCTFEFNNGERVEFSVTSSVYSKLSEGDSGTLVYRGIKFLSFS